MPHTPGLLAAGTDLGPHPTLGDTGLCLLCCLCCSHRCSSRSTWHPHQSPHSPSPLAARTDLVPPGTQPGPQYAQRSPRGTEEVEEPDIVDTPMHRRMHMWWSAFDTRYMQPVFGGEWPARCLPARAALRVAACSDASECRQGLHLCQAASDTRPCHPAFSCECPVWPPASPEDTAVGWLYAPGSLA